jgi:hypothetical protein
MKIRVQVWGEDEFLREWPEPLPQSIWIYHTGKLSITDMLPTDPFDRVPVEKIELRRQAHRGGVPYYEQIP